MIDETRSQIPVWLIWARFDNDVVTLVAVVLDQRRIDGYRKIIESDSKVVQVRVEKSEANHLYHPEWDARWQEAYGEEFLQAYREYAVAVHTQELQKQLKDLLEAGIGVLDSFENYCADKPEDEWDEYDGMMIPRWKALRAAIVKARGAA